MKKYRGVKVEIGTGAEIDEDVILGYPSSRLSGKGKVKIGSRARVRSGSIIYQNVTIGDQFQTGHHVIIREENEIGDSVSIWSNTVVDYGCRIGDRVKIHCNGYVAQGTVIEEDVFIAPGAVFANDKYPVSPHFEGPRVKRGAKIGVNVTILPGVTVGEEALVGAGTVVTKDVPSRSVVVGNPGRVIGPIEGIVGKKESILKEKPG